MSGTALTVLSIARICIGLFAILINGTSAGIDARTGDLALGLTAGGTATRESSTTLPDRLSLLTDVLHTTDPPDRWMSKGAWFGEFDHNVHHPRRSRQIEQSSEAPYLMRSSNPADPSLRQRRAILHDTPVEQELSNVATQLEGSADGSDDRGDLGAWFHDKRDEQSWRPVHTAGGMKQRKRDISRALSDLARALAEDGADHTGLAEETAKHDDDMERRCEDDGWEEAWDSWTSCSATCQTDERAPCPRRSRKRVDGCPGIQHQECNCLSYCPVDCRWNDWNEWSDCSQTCNGQRTRTRSLIPPKYGGSCTHETNELMDTLPCNSVPCPVDCEWADWGAFGSCEVRDKSCDAWSSRYRYRVKNVNEEHGGSCIGGHMSHERCHWVPCPIDCQWDSWGDWSVCSATCAGGERKRHRRTKQVALHGGRLCEGHPNHVQTCNSQPCPVDCVWGSWGEFTDCTKSCGGGAKERSRGYHVHVANGGKPCLGDADELLPCNVFYCPVDCTWDDWDDWGPCSTSCGGGTKTAVRTHITLARWGGSNETCHGSDTRVSTCSENPCPTSLVQSPITATLLRRH